MEGPVDEPERESLELLFGDITGFLKKVNDSPIAPEPLTSGDLAIQSKFGKQFFGLNLNPTMIYTLERRDVLKEFPNRFIIWKKVMKKMGENGRINRRTAELVEALTITDLAKIAAEEFKKAAENAGRQIPGSEELQKARKYADYWSRIQEVSKEVAEDEERKSS